jgi:hypothetical protein
MKPQDIIFIIILIFLLWKRKPEWFIFLGLFSFLCSIPLFAYWIFFTAQRFIYYGFSFFLLGIIFSLPILRKRGYNKKDKNE